MRTMFRLSTAYEHDPDPAYVSAIYYLGLFLMGFVPGLAMGYVLWG